MDIRQQDKSNQQQQQKLEVMSIDVKDLHFRFNPQAFDILRGVDIQLRPGDRCLLIGANGAGKSTLLQILAGKRMTRSKAKVLGQDVFFNTPEGVTYLGTEWASNPVVRSDLIVSHFLDSIGGYRHKARRDKLLDILDVDLDWHMHQISDGERRRVQIVQGLMSPWKLLLLDEVTVDLDVMVRQELLDFLVEDSKARNSTILYATHIFDGLDTFPTHVCHLQIGSTTLPTPIKWPINPNSLSLDTSKGQISIETLEKLNDPNRVGSRLLILALNLLKNDREVRLRLESDDLIPQFKKRGSKLESSVPTDSESFYRKYDYTNNA
ncbi:P-loop containing nucleoside triphosphate hydrolase protein [Phakopsora pachyrhizi]|uniref:P-loop containing nucleoside triphosphate hydrolase protein n=1 Tax=Phakopsora pachyrhizi TaxID=170000 RepID=A0AAV0BH98_PHAPC|nr:P-loop containing nucleoside triphosphate hydrolase protein [Phakopsora pachyrhizi]CAH7686705.1 P-loop containing nucleoside triphosphate hydrolase protein [Phakopsora pachyrhizi]